MLITIIPFECIESSVELILIFPPSIVINISAFNPLAVSVSVSPVVLIVKSPSLIINLVTACIPSLTLFILKVPPSINTKPLPSSVSFVDFIASPLVLIVKFPSLIYTESFPRMASSIEVILYVPELIVKSSFDTIPSA